MSQLWTYDRLGFVHIELSSHCNAACPNCPRFYAHTETVRPDLELASITFEQFTTWFPLDLIKRIQRWVFCGTNGDPMMAKDVYEILEYIVENSNASIQLNTNGGTRNAEFYTKLGKLFNRKNLFQFGEGPHRHVIFSVDGLEDTNHIYRRNVKWDVVWNNMKAYGATGAQSQWDYLIFKHNEHQLAEAERLSKEIGITVFAPKRALGFEGRNPGEYKNMSVRDKEGNFLYWIEPPSPEYQNVKGPLVFKEESTEKYTTPDKKISKEEKIEFMLYNANKMKFKFNEHNKNKTVHCKSIDKSKKMEIYVDATGNVMPCCYVGTWFNANYTNPEAIQLQKSIYDWGLDKINLHNNSLESILNSEYLDSTFKDRWHDAPESNRMNYCFETCGIQDNYKDTPVDRIYLMNDDKRKVK